MSSVHALFHYSVTCGTDDVAVLYCLRALADLAEQHPQNKIAWGNTGKEAWRRNGHEVTFHFTKPSYRQVFRDEANELLGGRWSEMGASDNDPATPRK